MATDYIANVTKKFWLVTLTSRQVGNQLRMSDEKFVVSLVSLEYIFRGKNELWTLWHKV